MTLRPWYCLAAMEVSCGKETLVDFTSKYQWTQLSIAMWGVSGEASSLFLLVLCSVCDTQACRANASQMPSHGSIGVLDWTLRRRHCSIVSTIVMTSVGLSRPKHEQRNHSPGWVVFSLSWGWTNQSKRLELPAQ